MNSVPKYIATIFKVKNSFKKNCTQFAISLQGIKVGMAVLIGTIPYVVVRKINENEFYYKLDQILVARSMKNFSHICLKNTKPVPTRASCTRYILLQIGIFL